MMTRSMMMFKEFKDTASNDDDQRKEGRPSGCQEVDSDKGNQYYPI